MRCCKRCLLPGNVAGAEIDAGGICHPCRCYSDEVKAEGDKDRREREQNLEKALQDCRGIGQYDCLVSFSGGKDSVYLLYRLVKEYKLRVLAYTSNFDLPDIAAANIKRTIAALGVDHLSYTPPVHFYRKFIRYLLMHQLPQGAVHTVCYFWLNLREGDLLTTAVEKNIPLILSGYAPGQPDPLRMVYELPRKRIEEDWTPYELCQKGILSDDDLRRFWNPKRFSSNTVFPRFLAPFHAWPYDQAAITAKVVSLGLVRNCLYASPILSNFSLNWLLMHSDLRNLGYNPYMPEFSQLIREGRANRTSWLILHPMANFMIKHQVLLGKHVKKALHWLEMRPEDLKIHTGE